MSHPSWVRGLKPSELRPIVAEGIVAPLVGAWIETNITIGGLERQIGSHPSWVRGLKQVFRWCTLSTLWSHPSWVRGLKLCKTFTRLAVLRRTPRGCVD